MFEFIDAFAKNNFFEVCNFEEELFITLGLHDANAQNMLRFFEAVSFFQEVGKIDVVGCPVGLFLN